MREFVVVVVVVVAAPPITVVSLVMRSLSRVSRRTLGRLGRANLVLMVAAEMMVRERNHAGRCRQIRREEGPGVPCPTSAGATLMEDPVSWGPGCGDGDVGLGDRSCVR
jgi:hypothetical protein